MIISELLKYPVRGLIFEGGNTLQSLSNSVSDACICLQENNIPYNVLIADCGQRIFLLPQVSWVYLIVTFTLNFLYCCYNIDFANPNDQCYAEKQALGEVSAELLDTQVNPAVWEISGHMVLKRKKDYEEASEENAWRLLAEVSLSEERFQEVCALIFEVIDTVDAENTEDSSSMPEEHGDGCEEHGDGCLKVVEARNNTTHSLPVTGTKECLV